MAFSSTDYSFTSALYSLIGQNNDDDTGVIDRTQDKSLYPGHRRIILPPRQLPPPPGEKSNTMMVQTGGNALQPMNKTLCNRNDIVKVVHPEGSKVGDPLLVCCTSPPDHYGRLIAAIIPPMSHPGHVFLVKVPPLPPKEPLVVTGVPVEWDKQLLTQVVQGYDASKQQQTHKTDKNNNSKNNNTTTQTDDLLLQEESSPSPEENKESDVEMVPNKNQIV